MKKDKKPLISMILGIVSMPLLCILIGVPLAFVGLCMGIVSLKRKSTPKSFSIIGIVTSSLTIIFFVLVIFSGSYKKSNIDSRIDKTALENISETVLETESINPINEENLSETSIVSETVSAEQIEKTVLETEVQTTEETSSTEDRALLDLKSVLKQNVAEKAYDILINQIGFTEVEYIGRNSVGDSNYDLRVDGYSVILTASDDVYRIFNRQTVYYEDGQVKNTASQADKKRISADDITYYYVIAQDIVESHLKTPKSAKFPAINEISFQRKDNIVAVKGYVDAKNSYNAKVRGEWIVEFEVVDLKNFLYNTIYVNIDGEAAGEWISLE